MTIQLKEIFEKGGKVHEEGKLISSFGIFNAQVNSNVWRRNVNVEWNANNQYRAFAIIDFTTRGEVQVWATHDNVLGRTSGRIYGELQVIARTTWERPPARGWVGATAQVWE